MRQSIKKPIKDLQGNFADFGAFQEAGAFGFVIRKGQEIVAGISTAFVYQKAIEIEIATKPADQKQGLVTVLGAKMILESLQRGLFPLWDAHNEASKKTAEKRAIKLRELIGLMSLKDQNEINWNFIGNI